uniref:Putative secreted protein n=1 Tax=Rhipicephalus microplus TaxID=6941 RepID=A0A6G5A2F8_RHIMP
MMPKVCGFTFNATIFWIWNLCSSARKHRSMECPWCLVGGSSYSSHHKVHRRHREGLRNLRVQRLKT